MKYRVIIETKENLRFFVMGNEILTEKYYEASSYARKRNAVAFAKRMLKYGDYNVFVIENYGTTHEVKMRVKY